ncbi:MAG TPA: PIG-L family deacetylase [Gemmatimonadales bacterium]|nr:PIG-L family deacetylase [Gemmatimonadales bacterium]
MTRFARTSLAALLLAGGTARAQALRPPGTGGIAALADALDQLGATKRVLIIGAHPDDENTQLLTLLARGQGAQVAYLSLTRGEGGQNLIGPELGVELGIIRTEELLAARELDGGRQFFTRAYDFGYSRSAEEAFRFWPRDTLLADVLEVIRRFRPQILVSIFSGTPRDGHGQHQVAGILARQAFEVLRDSSWGPVKLYRSASFDTAGATLTLPAGDLDPLSGQSYFQIAMASRSRHRSQDMGRLQTLGPSVVRLELLASKTGGDGGFWAGVDTASPGGPRYLALLDSARAVLEPRRPDRLVPYLARARRQLDGRDPEQGAILERALAAAAGVVIDAVSDDDIVAAGQRLQVEVSVWNAGRDAIQLEAVDLAAPAGWEVQRLDAAASPVGPGVLVNRRFVVTLSRDAERSQPYYLRRPPVGGLYDWTGAPAAWRGLPFEPPPLEARIGLRVAGERIGLAREVVYRYRDQARGEVRRPLVVTGEFDVRLEPELVVWSTEGAGAGAGPRRLAVTVTNRTRGAASARVVLSTPAGWPAPPVETVSFTREDEPRTLVLELAVPPGIRPGTYAISAGAVGADGRRWSGGLALIDYPHIRPRAISRPSRAEIRAAPIRLPALRLVGYVRGAADRVPEALAAVGVPLEVLPADSLARGDLSRYDAVVIGSRAYETDPALVTSNARLLDYARGGGLVIVQYQQYDFVEGGFAPYRLTIARPHDRVTDETAPVTPLLPDHPVFTTPNRLGPGDWEGWVQERGLYFARDWDSTFVPVLETHDPGREPLRGGLLIAPLGRGIYVYTGLSFFRQLPAGVPGAYRLFANLLALGRR